MRAGGNEVLAIPHNGNASNGLMFPEVLHGGSAIDRAYAQTRMRNEPVYEVTQIKGTSETHPTLSPNDEFASFELWDYTLSVDAKPMPEHKKGGYVREALERPEARVRGQSPIRSSTGLIDSTHNASASTRRTTTPASSAWRSTRAPADRPARLCRGHTPGRSASSVPAASPPSGRRPTPARRSSMRWCGRRPTPLPAQG